MASIEKLNIEICSRCGYIKIRGNWIRIPLEEAIKKSVNEKLRVDPNFQVDEIILADKFLILKGVLNEDVVEVTVPFTYRFRKICCPRCSMESGGYYEAIVQVRADKRDLKVGEIEKAKEITNRFLLESEGEKDFLTKFEVNKNGIDFYLGSRKLGEKISRKIAEELGGKVFESKKLHTRVDGRDFYRFTFLVRLPEYEEMDIVEKGDTLYVVKNIRMAKGFDFLSGKYANIMKTNVAVKREFLRWGVITNLDESSAEVTTEKGVVIVQRPFGAEIGKEVFVFEYKNKNYAFPKDL